jgi:hypothetical protein
MCWLPVVNEWTYESAGVTFSLDIPLRYEFMHWLPVVNEWIYESAGVRFNLELPL